MLFYLFLPLPLREQEFLNTDGYAGDGDGNSSEGALYLCVIIHRLADATLQPDNNRSHQPKLLIFAKQRNSDD